MKYCDRSLTSRRRDEQQVRELSITAVSQTPTRRHQCYCKSNLIKRAITTKMINSRLISMGGKTQWRGQSTAHTSYSSSIF